MSAQAETPSAMQGMAA